MKSIVEMPDFHKFVEKPKTKANGVQL